MNEKIVAEILDYKPEELEHQPNDSDEEAVDSHVSSGPSIEDKQDSHRETEQHYSEIHEPAIRVRDALEKIFRKAIKKKGFRIAEFNFTFNNGAVIELLKQRATYLADDDIEMTNDVNRKIEEKIQSLVDTKDLVIPNSAFVTFETEKGCLFWRKKGEIKLYDEKVELK